MFRSIRDRITIRNFKAKKKKTTIVAQSRDLCLNNEPSLEKQVETLKEIAVEAVYHLVRRIVQDGDIDLSLLEKEGTNYLFSVKVYCRREKWDLDLLLESDVEYKDME